MTLLAIPVKLAVVPPPPPPPPSMTLGDRHWRADAALTHPDEVGRGGLERYRSELSGLERSSVLEAGGEASGELDPDPG